MSACLAGAVCGDHCSPISDTTIMSSAGARCDHINHVQTQIPYAITVAAISFVGYIFAGFVTNWMIVLPVMAVVTILVLFILKKATAKK
jgi:Na+/H+ antiporter NhaC